MTTLICIDPGVTKGHYWVRGCSAHFDDAGILLTTKVWIPTVSQYDRVVIEMPEIIFGAKPPADIIDLARAAERCVAWYTAMSACNADVNPPQYVTPAQWKAGDKNGHQLAVWDALTSNEQAVLLKLAPRSTAAKIRETLSRRCVNGTKSEYPFGNAIDAAGIYLYTVGRIDKFGRKAI